MAEYTPPPEYWDEVRQHDAVIFKRRRLPTPLLMSLAFPALKFVCDGWYSHTQQSTCRYLGIRPRRIAERVIQSRYAQLEIVPAAEGLAERVFRVELALGIEGLRMYRHLPEPTGGEPGTRMAGLQWLAVNLGHEDSQAQHRLDAPDEADYDAALTELRLGAALAEEG